MTSPGECYWEKSVRNAFCFVLILFPISVDRLTSHAFFISTPITLGVVYEIVPVSLEFYVQHLFPINWLGIMNLTK